MAHPATSDSVQAYALCVVVLYLKFFVTTRFEGPARYSAGSRAPEDVALGPIVLRPRTSQSYGLQFDPRDERMLKAKMLEKRWDRIVMNDLENLPLALFVFGAALLLECSERVQIASMGVFTVARIAFTIFYAKSMQPHRTLAYTMGLLAVGASILDILATLYSRRR